MEEKSLIASSKGGNFPLAPAGAHLARCYMVVDLGTQNETFKGQAKTLHKVRIGFELPTEKHVFFDEKGPEPFSLSKEYTLSLSDKANLRKDLESWRGRPFDEEELKKFNILRLAGAPCLLNVIHKTSNNRTFANIASIMPMPASMKKDMPPAILPPKIFVISDGVNSNEFKALPEWIREEIQQALEICGQPTTQGSDATPKGESAEEDDGVPF